MSKFSHIEVRAANTQTRVLDHECDIVWAFDTIKEAKTRVKYWMSEDYLKFNSDITQPVRYAQIWVTEGGMYEKRLGIAKAYCHSEFWAKGYNGETVEADSI